MHKLEIELNDFLEHEITAYYHGSHGGWKNTEVGYINTLKNDEGTFNNVKKDFGFTLSGAQQKLAEALVQDLPLIADSITDKLTVCVMPRSKRNNQYLPTQLLFIDTIKSYILENAELFNDGTDYIRRVIDTPTTHITKNYDSVQKGITHTTCEISDNVTGKNILLIDDIYTEGANIDEDAIQAVYDKGANSVIFYAVGRTI